jgi:hypothetical protein
MSNNGQTCLNCGQKYWDWDFCCQAPAFSLSEQLRDENNRLRNALHNVRRILKSADCMAKEALEKNDKKI